MRPARPAGQIVRVLPRHGEAVTIEVDGIRIDAFAGESLLVAVLTQGHRLRRLEFGGESRAGFCLMGACQDCWVEVAGLGRLRACTTPVATGMCVLTEAPPDG